MQRSILKDFFELDESVALFLHLDRQSLGRLQQTSTFFNTALSAPYGWRERLVRDLGEEFGFEMDTLTAFEETAKRLNVIFSYQIIYKHLLQIKQWRQVRDEFSCKINEHNYLFVIDPAKIFILLAVCAVKGYSALYKYYAPSDDEYFWERFRKQAGIFYSTNSSLIRSIVKANPINTLKSFKEMPNSHPFKAEILLKGIHLEEIIFEAARPGSLGFFQEVLKVINCCPMPETFEAAIKGGNLPIVQYHLEERGDLSPLHSDIHNAIASGNLEVVECLVPHVCPPFKPATAALLLAINAGSLELVEWIFSKEGNLIVNNDVFYAALNHEAILEYLLTEKRDLFKLSYSSIMSGLARRANLPALHKVLPADPAELAGPNQQTLNEASAAGDLAVVEQLFKSALLPKKSDLHFGICSGSLAATQFILKNSAFCPDAWDAVGAQNHPLLLLYLLDPRNNFFIRDLDAFFILNKHNIHPPLCAHAHANSGFTFLVSDKYQSSYNHLIAASNYSLRHFFRLCVYACQQPTQYQLQIKHIDYLITLMKEITLTYKARITPIEFETIISLLETASTSARESNNLNVASALAEMAESFKQKQMNALVRYVPLPGGPA